MENNQTPTPYPPAPQLQHLLQQQNQQLQMFWNYQRQEMEQVADFKNHQLPLARIKKIMKADEDVRMISAEAPVLFAKACELFVLELTIRSWIHAEENKRRTLQKNDIAAAITRTDVFDFLVDIVPREEAKEDVVVPGIGTGVPYYYPPGVGTVASGVMMGQPAMDPAMYMQHQQMWPPGVAEEGSYGQQSLEGQQHGMHPFGSH
nr:nuclear factor Y transcription factor [Asarum sieboldii]